MNNSLDSGSVYAAMDDTPVVQYAIGQGKDYAINIKPESIGSFAFAVKKVESTKVLSRISMKPLRK